MEAYQTFEGRPRVRLTALPSPLQRAEGFEASLRAEGMHPPRIYIKRDDLLGLAFGGNKIRNLEFALGAAMAAGATDVITGGRVQSNHCRLTAAACARAGLAAHVVLTGDEPAHATGNLLLCHLLGASVHFTRSDDRAVRQQMMDGLATSLRAAGRVPFVIPVGGSDESGAYGHVLAVAELLAQCTALEERPTSIVLATATGGTQAGMLAGLRRAGAAVQIDAFAVAKNAADLRPEVLAIANELARRLRIAPFEEDNISIDDGFLGAGYGIPTAAGQDAVTRLARSEGIVADPVYTGKALAGLIARVRSRAYAEDDAIVWIHTGGTPANFADLPATPM